MRTIAARAVLVLVVPVLAVLAGCGDNDPVTTRSGSSGGSQLVVGSANFPENVLLAQLYAGALQAKGVQVSKKLNIGSRETYLPGLQDGSIDLIPEYTGSLLVYFDKKATVSSPDQVYAALPGVLPSGLKVLEKSTAEDKDAIVVTKATADKYRLTSIADLASVSGGLVLGGPPEFKTRTVGVPGLAAKYGVTFKDFRALDTGTLTVNALKNGQVQAADIFTTDPSIPAHGLVVLSDPQSLFAAQNVVPLINASKATPQVTDALNAVSAKLDTKTLTGLLAQVITDKQEPATVAADWLKANGLA